MQSSAGGPCLFCPAPGSALGGFSAGGGMWSRMGLQRAGRAPPLLSGLARGLRRAWGSAAEVSACV